jgi:hypothetical protein
MVNLTPPHSQPLLQLVGSGCPHPEQVRLRKVWRPPVFVVRNSHFPVRFLSFVRFSLTMPRSYSTPTERHCTSYNAQWNTAFPLTLQGRLPQHDSLRSCINLQEVASLPAAWSIPCLRFIHAVPPCDTPLGGRLFVGNAVPSAIFIGLANINARLGSYSWLGL